uniref:GHF2 protein n=1 Tax=uncultured bacterium H1_5 TaxID=1112297 RepID=G9IS48_9BACT|nr:GHF2 protein [uncultured bacterium H1_5]
MKTILLVVFFIASFTAYSQRPGTIYDEEKIPQYTLPEILVAQNGRKIRNLKQWEKIRKPEILRLFQQEVFGKIPGKLEISEVIVHENNGEALGGLAVRKQLDLIFRRNNQEISVGLLIYLPKTDAKVPVFLGYNFMGNHTILNDPDIRLSQSWIHDNPSLGVIHNQITEQSRGVQDNRWHVEKIIKAGYGLATVYYGDIDPDKNDFLDGIHPLFYNSGQENPASDEWGAIAAWSWGLSRVMDYLEKDEQVNAKQVIVIGHSRLGKTAIWAAASDPRFAACISNDSGCMGAALSKRIFGETVGVINSSFPHWFCGNFKKYNGREDELPVDQHLLLATIAPRPLYVASATEDLWADPKGEFLSAKLVSKVYLLYGLKGLAVDEMPKPDSPVSGVVSYHIRTGKHDITGYDWEQYIRFADEQVKKKVTSNE